MTEKMVSAGKQAKRTGHWAKVMAKWLISYSSKGGTKWQLVAFDGKKGGESRGIVDFLAIRKDFSAPVAPLKRGDLFELILIQSKGGSAAWPTDADISRLSAVGARYGAKHIVLADWQKGKAPTLYKWSGARWDESSARSLFGSMGEAR